MGTIAQLLHSTRAASQSAALSTQRHLYSAGRPSRWALARILVLSIFFFSSPNLSRRRLDVCHTATHGVEDAGLKRAARGSLKIQYAKKSPKIAICAPSHNFVRQYLRYISTIGKKTC